MLDGGNIATLNARGAGERSGGAAPPRRRGPTTRARVAPRNRCRIADEVGRNGKVVICRRDARGFKLTK